MKKNLLILFLSLIIANISYGLNLETKNAPVKETYDQETDLTVNYDIPPGKYLFCTTECGTKTYSYLEYKDKTIKDIEHEKTAITFLTKQPALIDTRKVHFLFRNSSWLIITKNQAQFIAHIKPYVGFLKTYSFTINCDYKDIESLA